MVRLVDDLLDVSRISRGKIELRKEAVELASVVNHAVEAVRPLCESMDHELTVTLPPKPMYLNGDPIRLAQVVGNLLNNACKFTDEGRPHSADGRAERTSRPSSECGTPASASPPTNFPASSRCSRRSIRRWSGRADGLGLGLTLVKNLVRNARRHGGSPQRAVSVRAASSSYGYPPLRDAAGRVIWRVDRHEAARLIRQQRASLPRGATAQIAGCAARGPPEASGKKGGILSAP